MRSLSLPQQKRKSASKRGYGRAWQKARAEFIQQTIDEKGGVNCAECGRMILGRIFVDHKEPHKDDEALFWDRDNWQLLDWSCHSRKTAKQDGGFGNRVRKS